LFIKLTSDNCSIKYLYNTDNIIYVEDVSHCGLFNHARSVLHMSDGTSKYVMESLEQIEDIMKGFESK
jgi:hypothetical protein